MKPYFLSHSSKDKPFVREVAAALGTDRCWLDEWEMHGGDDLFSNIDAALESVETEVFVLFWSRAASQSVWVNEEVGAARMRKLRRDDIRIVPVRLDDCALPLWMSRLVYLDASNGSSSVAKELQSLQTNTLLLSSQRSEVEQAFQNRRSEADALEVAYHDSETSGVTITGFPGIGKTALCRFVLRQRLPHLKALWIDIERFNSPALFFASLAEREALRLPRAVVDSAKWDEYWSDYIFPTIDPDSDVLLLDGLNHVLDNTDSVPRWLLRPLADLTSLRGPNRLPLIVISSRVIDFQLKTARVMREIFVSKLPDEEVIRALRIRLTTALPRRHATQEQLEKAASIVGGYPLAAQLWSALAGRVGVELALLDPSPVQKQIQAFVADILSKCQLTEREERALLILSLARVPLAPQDLTEGLAVAAEDLRNLQKSMLLDPSAHGLAVHNLVGRFMVQHISSHQSAKRAHEDLGRFFLNRWRSSTDGLALSTALASQAFFHLTAAGRLDEASTIKWSVLEETKNAIAELYRTRQDEAVITAVRNACEVGRVDDQVFFYYALSLGRTQVSNENKVEGRKIFEELLGRNPSNRYYWVGYGDALTWAGEDSDAKEAYMKARALARPDDPLPSQKLGEILLREGDIESARNFLSEAYSRAPHDSRVMAGYALVLHRAGNQDKALNMVRDGLRRWPDDIPLNHRAGMILRDMGKNMEALPHLTRAAKGETSPASYLSLADLYLEMGRTKEATKVLDKVPGAKTPAYYNIKGNIARREGRFQEAEDCFQRCKRMEGDSVVLLGSVASLRIAQAEKALEMLADGAAKAYIVDAEEVIRRGLALDSENEALLNLRRDSARIRLAAIRQGEG